MSLFLPLRAVVQRLGSTPSSELPATVGALASSISNCRDAFQKSGTDSAEINVLINKLKARITTLFRDRSADQYKAKFSAVVLTKATIEAGGWEILNGCEAWVKELLDLVKVFEQLPKSRTLADHDTETWSFVHQEVELNHLDKNLHSHSPISDIGPASNNAISAHICHALLEYHQ